MENANKSPLANEPLLRIEGVSKIYDGLIKAVDQVTLNVASGEIFALLGGSGCGKSTLLRMLAGFETPSQGRIYLGGTDITDLPAYQRPINMMFQSYALFPHLSVSDNIAFGLRRDGMAKEAIAERVEAMLKLVQLSQYAKRKPHQLSGGQQQRVALARSIAKQPKLLLLDEPLGALDKKLRVSTQIELVNIIEEVGVTCVLVTHDQEEAMTMATRMAVMSTGSFLQVGSPKDIYQQPNSRQVADFIGSVNIFDGLVKQSPANSAQAPGIQVECADALLRVPSNQACHAGMAVGVAIRPEKIVLSRKKPTAKVNHLAGVITEMAYFGAHTSYHVKLASGKVLQAQVQSHADEASADLSWGDQVYASWSDNAMVLLTQ
jgi:spermidine/putrescine ABC transporter ATP-binding subunit